VRPAQGAVILDRLRGGRRTTLRLNDDGSYLLHVNDVAEPAAMDARGAIDWLAAFVAELAPPPSPREMYGSDRGFHGRRPQAA